MFIERERELYEATASASGALMKLVPNRMNMVVAVAGKDSSAFAPDQVDAEFRASLNQSADLETKTLNLTHAHTHTHTHPEP